MTKLWSLLTMRKYYYYYYYYYYHCAMQIFWLIPPTEENLQAYENWTMSGRQGDTFFGDVVPLCHRVTLEAGFTFLIPTGRLNII